MHMRMGCYLLVLKSLPRNFQFGLIGNMDQNYFFSPSQGQVAESHQVTSGELSGDIERALLPNSDLLSVLDAESLGTSPSVPEGLWGPGVCLGCGATVLHHSHLESEGKNKGRAWKSNLLKPCHNILHRSAPRCL